MPDALRGIVDPGAILHYDQSLEIFEPLDPGGAELQSWCALVSCRILRRFRCSHLSITHYVDENTADMLCVAAAFKGTIYRDGTRGSIVAAYLPTSVSLLSERRRVKGGGR